ncbi:linear amide C-N hydrolase [Mycolicibacter senuensis]|uniref:Choloylglycine hydrolase n=1 Tax=Mycolicibacter senuensis TaxID=386913 RepID=A0A7I9XLW3_9MYCO|nr:linear amide C-N hydrolase [Mycolicibacter senuensis]ORW69432.1 choloylglycine hydrolase [Mycolicibacter senuensis]GFG70961.1 choloylglycine hydrolase [Mycolicibacter senuensis]
MCTRLVYLGPNGNIITGRSMDWKLDLATDLWSLPRGVTRDGRAGANSIEWTAKYGSVVATGYDICTTDGLNEAGLSANLLWLAESEFPAHGGSRPGMSVAIWAQYMLDNFATVAGAVAALQTEPFDVLTEGVPGEERLATLHLSMSDGSGDSAIVEYVGGKQVIHHSRDYQVMTNSPIFEQQLAVNAYWEQLGGTVMLPGTNRAADRFARASFYVNAIPKVEDPKIALASVFSVVRNVSVPFGISTPDEPNISSTRWRTVAHHTRKLYCFESALTPNVFWVDLNKLDLTEGAPARKLDLGRDESNTFAGESSAEFAVAEPFTFLGITT